MELSGHHFPQYIHYSFSDFNEVRSESERMGTIFDQRGAANFNDFITIADLCDLSIGGKWFTRMNNLVNGSPSVSFKNKLQHLKKSIKQWRLDVSRLDGIDNKAESHPLNSEEIDDRIQWVKLLANFEHQKVKDLRQKAKFKWALEGDENSQFFHGIMNNRRNMARINGLNIHGDWVTKPLTIKNHILNFFSNRFKEENCSRPQFTSLFKQLSQDDIQFLDCSFTTLEIKEAVWDCGSAKSSGPDGFTFKFFKKHWDIVEHDVVSYVKDFEVSAHTPKGCNSSFITLVPKVEDPLTIGDFRPISLIGCQYKIIAKILARRLSRVVSSVIRDVQMAFIKGRQIIDGPLIVDEIIA
ncbi:RNA-directed DNA polymerase, eukaryota [Tanacetum coccineum]